VTGSTEDVESLGMFADIVSRDSPLLIAGPGTLVFLLHVESCLRGCWARADKNL
jgi:hypothetical protein